MKVGAPILGIMLSASLQPAPSDQLGELYLEALRAMRDGDYEKAEKRVSASEAPQSLRLRMELADRRGDRELARQLAQRLLDLHQRGRLQGPEETAQAAVAARRLDLWHEANDIFIEAAEQPSPPSSLYIDWGQLYIQQYHPGDAQAIFQDAIRAGPDPSPTARWGLEDAYIGLARSIGALGGPGADQALEKAAEINSDNLRLIAFRALEAIQGSNWKDAGELLDRGLSIDKRNLRLMELKAAFHFFQFQEKDFKKSVDRVLEINPVNADLYETLGDLCVPRRRLYDAIRFYQKAVDQNPRQWSALAALGINLLRVGEETRGKLALERAYENDPFNLWTVNTLRLLDSFKNFTRFETPHFSAKIATEEVHALRPYVEELLERSLTVLAEKYGLEVSDKYVFEMYRDHEDFAVRTLGLPGLGALGATFGKVVAMDSPSARPGGKFHWGSTLWHEVAHIVTLALSDQKVPRWFTEGLSMMEERLAVEGWGDFLSLKFVDAYREDKLLSLAELDEGFQRPKFPGQIELSYFQAGWICDFLASRYGAEKIRAMLLAYGEGRPSEEVFQEVLGVSIEDVDREFRAEMDRTLKPLLPRLERPAQIDAGGGELEMAVVLQAVERDPDNYFANLAAARKLIGADRLDEAAPLLEKAIEIFPTEAGPTSPYAVLLDLYRKLGLKDKEFETLRKWWDAAPRFARNGVGLASMLMERGETAEAVDVLRGVMYVDPLKKEPHRMLGELYMEQGQTSQAVAEFRTLLRMRPPDAAGAHFLLADALSRDGRKQEARQQVLLALEIAPGYEEAQKLLLKLVRP